MAYTNLNFVPGEILTAAKMNLLAANDASFRDGTGIGDNTIQASKLKSLISSPDSNGWRYKAIENTYYKNIVNQPSVSLSSSGVSGDTKELWSTTPPAGFSDFSRFEIQCTALMGSGSGVVLRWQGGTDRLRLFARNTASYPNQDTGSWHAYLRLTKIS